jgi:Dyp-type peroxidase family
MTRHVDLWDVQGNIVRSYGRYGYPHACHLFFHFASREAGRMAIAFLIPLVTKGVTWWPADTDQESKPPDVTLNLGLTFNGLRALDLPTAALAGMPEEFIDGMARRAPVLGDDGPSDPASWDPIWRNSAADPAQAVHLWVALNGRMDPATGAPVAAFEHRVSYVSGLASPAGFGPIGLRLLDGHGRDGGAEQRGGLRIAPDPAGGKTVLPFEHFGFADGISDPTFEGQDDLPVDASVVAGSGSYAPRSGWSKLATGEFILGTVDESQEIARASTPDDLIRNGSFAVFRKLEQDVPAFNAYVAGEAAVYAAAQGIPLDEAEATLRAKMVGRWPNGAPLATCPTYADMLAFQTRWSDIPEILSRPAPRPAADAKRLFDWRMALNDFTYRDDRVGVRCPLGAHIRRGNPRDMLDPLIDSTSSRRWTGSALTNRRRILRRGIPYGPFASDTDTGTEERGILFIAICADLQRQFEFVQRQWINHGMDMGAGNSGCPVIGRREHGHGQDDVPAFAIPQPEGSNRPPHLLPAMPDFVRTRGGEYFFLPSMTALRRITKGAFDPT